MQTDAPLFDFGLRARPNHNTIEVLRLVVGRAGRQNGGRGTHGQKYHRLYAYQVVAVLDPTIENKPRTFADRFLKSQRSDARIWAAEGPIYTSIHSPCSGNGQYTGVIVEGLTDDAITCKLCRPVRPAQPVSAVSAASAVKEVAE